MKIILITLFTLFYSYAIVRYHFGKNIPWKEWYFILNKAFAWFSFTLISLTILLPHQLKKIKFNRRSLGILGYGIAMIHIISTLYLFNEEHFGKLYTAHEINLRGYFSISAGILSFLIFTVPFVASVKNLPNSSKLFSLGKVGFGIIILHPTVIGISSWLAISDWPYYLPPITLLAFLSGITFIILRINGKKHS